MELSMSSAKISSVYKEYQAYQRNALVRSNMGEKIDYMSSGRNFVMWQ